MTHFEMYLITRMDVIQPILVLTGLAVVALALIRAADHIASPRWNHKGFRHPLCIAAAALLLFFGAALIPSTKDIALIYAVPAIVNNTDIQAIPPELAKLARIEIEKMLKENGK